MTQAFHQKLSALWERRDSIFIAAVAAALCFGLGMWTQAYREDLKAREHLADTLSWTCNSLRMMGSRCLRGSGTPFAEDASAQMDLSILRYDAARLADALLDDLPLCKRYPEASSYLHDLCWYLLQTDFENAEALGPMLDLSQPLRTSYVYGAELSENLAALETWLATEEGTAVLSVLRPRLNGSTNQGGVPIGTEETAHRGEGGHLHPHP